MLRACQELQLVLFISLIITVCTSNSDGNATAGRVIYFPHVH